MVLVPTPAASPSAAPTSPRTPTATSRSRPPPAASGLFPTAPPPTSLPPALRPTPASSSAHTPPTPAPSSSPATTSTSRPTSLATLPCRLLVLLLPPGRSSPSARRLVLPLVFTLSRLVATSCGLGWLLMDRSSTTWLRSLLPLASALFHHKGCDVNEAKLVWSLSPFKKEKKKLIGSSCKL